MCLLEYHCFLNIGSIVLAVQPYLKTTNPINNVMAANSSQGNLQVFYNFYSNRQ